MILASRDGIVWETSSGRNQQGQPSCRSSKTLRTLAPLSTGERARFEKILPLLVPGRFAFLWRNGNFVSTMCTQPTFAFEVFERIQDMLLDNYAEYDRNKTRGVPRKGSALLHGMVYCGECGHKLVVQYKGGTRYLCNAPRVRNIVCPSANIFRGMPSTPPS